VLLRLLALLISIGMIVISTQGPALDATPDTAALVDVTDDVPFTPAESTLVAALPPPVAVLPTPASQPRSHCHELCVFRPPRAALA
jgi:hypothetical protein